MARLTWLWEKMEPLEGFKEINEPVWLVISSDFLPEIASPHRLCKLTKCANTRTYNKVRNR